MSLDKFVQRINFTGVILCLIQLSVFSTICDEQGSGLKVYSYFNGLT